MVVSANVSLELLEPSAADLALIREGRRCGSVSAWEAACADLLRVWEPTVARMARRYAPERSLCPDFAQVARLALVRAAMRYRHGPGHRFEHFARRCLRHALLDEARRLRRVPHPSADAGRELYDRENGLTLVLRAETRRLVRERVGRWTRRLRLLIDLLFTEGMTQVEAARVLGLTPARINQLVQEIRRGGRRMFHDLVGP